jgi:bifunctional non-homologous end joining protein LigD
MPLFYGPKGMPPITLTMKTNKPTQSISPMLATLVREPFNNPEWLYEVKWDGYRIIAHINKASVRLDSRGGLDYTSKYPPVVDALKKMKGNIILDGEVVVLNEQGLPDFDALQKYRPGQHLVYYVFDLLSLNGKDLMHLPLTKRKEQLEKLLNGNETIRYSDHFDDGLELFNHMWEMGMEGVVAKLRTSIYTPGLRSKNWLKIPTEKRQEFIIGGWVDSDKSTRSFKTLLFGAYIIWRLSQWKTGMDRSWRRWLQSI